MVQVVVKYRYLISFSFLFYLVLICVITFLVPCCDVRYDIRMKTMFSSSLLPVVCRRAHVLFTLFVFVFVKWCQSHIVLCFWFGLVSCVPYNACFSGLSLFDCHFAILERFFCVHTTPFWNTLSSCMFRVNSLKRCNIDYLY